MIKGIRRFERRVQCTKLKFKIYWVMTYVCLNAKIQDPGDRKDWENSTKPRTYLGERTIQQTKQVHILCIHQKMKFNKCCPSSNLTFWLTILSPSFKSGKLNIERIGGKFHKTQLDATSINDSESINSRTRLFNEKIIFLTNIPHLSTFRYVRRFGFQEVKQVPWITTWTINGIESVCFYSLHTGTVIDEATSIPGIDFVLTWMLYHKSTFPSTCIGLSDEIDLKTHNLEIILPETMKRRMLEDLFVLFCSYVLFFVCLFVFVVFVITCFFPPKSNPTVEHHHVWENVGSYFQWWLTRDVWKRKRSDEILSTIAALFCLSLAFFLLQFPLYSSRPCAFVMHFAFLDHRSANWNLHIN